MRQYLLHHDREKGEIQLRVCDSLAIGFATVLDSVQIDNDSVPKDRDKWLAWHQKWRSYFSAKRGISAAIIQ